jgi:hypothetical protein
MATVAGIPYPSHSAGHGVPNTLITYQAVAHDRQDRISLPTSAETAKKHIVGHPDRDGQLCNWR